METENLRVMTVKHSIENDEHVVRIYTPNSDYVFRHARWSVAEMDSIEAIWCGYFEASDWAERYGAHHVAVYSSDTAALDQFSDELNGGGGE